MRSAEPIAHGPDRLIRGLVRPSPAVTDRSEQRTARLLSTILLLLAPLALLSAVLQLAAGAGQARVQGALAAATVAIAIAYALSRTRHFRIAGAITTLIPTAAGLGVLALDTHDPGWFAFMALSPALGGLLVAIPWSMLLAGVNLLTVVAATLVTDLDADVAIVAIMFNSIVTVVLLTAAIFRDRLEQDRRADLVARKQLEDSILANSFAGIAVVRNGVIEEANQNFSDLFGATDAGLAGRPMRGLFESSSDDAVPGSPARAGSHPVELTALRSDGSSFVAEVIVQHTPDQTAEVIALRDITERKRADEALLRAQRLESVGRLAAGIAHDTNNELFVISAHADELMRQQKDAGMPTGAVQQIRDAAERVSNLIGRVLLVGRGEEVIPQAIALSEFIDESGPMWRQVLGRGIDLRLEPGDDGCVWISRGHLEQLLLNLVLNARDALDGAGEVRIAVDRVVMAPDVDLPVDLRPGAYQRIAIADDGSGIAPQHLPHVFDPFFTTKDDAGGTGLGLYTSREIVRRAGGELTVESTIAGTAFVVHLPEHAPAGSD